MMRMTTRGKEKKLEKSAIFFSLCGIAFNLAGAGQKIIGEGLFPASSSPYSFPATSFYFGYKFFFSQTKRNSTLSFLPHHVQHFLKVGIDLHFSVTFGLHINSSTLPLF